MVIWYEDDADQPVIFETRFSRYQVRTDLLAASMLMHVTV
jgi:hypothetical protein